MKARCAQHGNPRVARASTYGGDGILWPLRGFRGWGEGRESMTKRSAVPMPVGQLGIAYRYTRTGQLGGQPRVFGGSATLCRLRASPLPRHAGVLLQRRAPRIRSG